MKHDLKLQPLPGPLLGVLAEAKEVVAIMVSVVSLNGQSRLRQFGIYMERTSSNGRTIT